MFFSRQLDKELISQCPLVTRSYWNTSDLRRRGFSKGSATVETVDAQLLLILSGKYIGYLPEHYAWPWIKENRLRVLLPNEFGFQSPFSAICKRGRSNEPTEGVSQSTQEEYGGQTEVERMRFVLNE